MEKRKSRIMSAEEAVAFVQSGSCLAVGGAGGVQEPDLLIEALVRQFKETGSPAGLTEFHPIRTGEIEGRGTSLFGTAGLVRRMIGGSLWPVGVPELIRRINANEMEAYNFSIGVMYGLLEAASANRPGLITRVGLGTFEDPIHGGGALNSISREKLVQRIEIDGEDFLYYRAIPVDTAFIRATTADELGNLTFEEEPAIIGALVLAQAAKANGGKVVAQVKRVVAAGSLNPHMVRVPGALVDAVVVNPAQKQITNVVFDPTLVGAEQLDIASVPMRPLDSAKVVMRRAFLEVRPDNLLAIGYGVPGFLPAIAIEEGVLDDVTFTVEHGVFGGVNGYAAGGKTFPVAHNPTAIIDAADQIRFFAGGGIDCAFLGVGEVDASGNVNVGRFGDRIPGSGGFVEMTQGIRKIVFCFVVGDRAGLKFTDQVQSISFNGQEAYRRGQHITYVTEKAVFELRENGLTLTEIAPGVDPRRDLLDAMPCRIEVAETLRKMPAMCFAPGPMNVRRLWSESRPAQ
ncbi:MAG TPA: CoA-transferase [Mesorhizobium sp.]